MSDLQRDIDEIDFLVAEFAGIEITAAWQRIRARLAEQSSAVASVASSPDRERVAESLYYHACIPGDFMWELLDEKAKDHWRAYAEAAIAAMEGKE